MNNYKFIKIGIPVKTDENYFNQFISKLQSKKLKLLLGSILY